MRTLLPLFYILFFLHGNLFSQNLKVPVISIDEKSVSNSICKQAIILVDADKKLSIENILSDTTLQYRQANNNVENLDFSTAGVWIRFKLQNNFEKEIRFILETARPVTNKVILYQVKGTKIITKMESGDNTPLHVRPITHRKCLFPIQLTDDNAREFVLYIESDGEVVSVPLVFWLPQDLMQSDYFYQLFLGIFYGVLFFVAVIYFFFFIALKEKSFLYYVIYVFWMAMLQLCLDGLAYQFLFPNSPYLADHFTVLSAIGAVWFVLAFANSFLKLREQSPKFNRVYRFLIPFIAFLFFFSLIPGPTYRFIYPLANIFSLVSVLLVLVTIINLKIRKKQVDWFFVSAFSLLVLSAAIFILGNLNVIENRELTEGALKVGSGLEVIFLSLSLARKYRELQEAKENAQQELLIQLEEKNALQANINVQLETQVKERTREIVHQKEEIEEKNKEITSSITYAKRIQMAILPPQETVMETIPDSFILYKPRDIVSGDFYFVYPVKMTAADGSQTQLSLFAAVDCTGHGVPGAFMSILGNNILKASLKEEHINTPGQALDYLNQKIIETLSQNQDESDGTIRDGMDIALCALNKSTNTLYFAGANNPGWVVTKNNGVKEVIELAANKQPIGNYGNNDPYTTHTYQTKKGDLIYIFTDGYADQFGGSKNKKLKHSRLKEILLENADLPMEEQKNILEKTFMDWKGKTEQTDDVLVIGVRV